ncbi:MAG: hypothetical protein ACKO8O_04520 [Betaproteobacteria bacterium]
MRAAAVAALASPDPSDSLGYVLKAVSTIRGALGGRENPRREAGRNVGSACHPA